MSEHFRIEPRANGVGFIIFWGPTHICEVFADRASAEAHCAILEALRRVDYDGADPDLLVDAWYRFRDLRNAGRH